MATVAVKTKNFGKATVEMGDIEALLFVATHASGCRSDAALARVLGVSRQALWNWRQGKDQPSDRYLTLILQIGGFVK
jgi:transcriptional regulator with XRE-family HTH domain